MIEIGKMFGFLNYIKYDVMRNISVSLFQNTEYEKETKVNIYIDLGSITEKLYNPVVDDSKDPTLLSSVIINFAGYLRYFFRRHLEVESDIFFVYSPNKWSYLYKLYPKWLKGKEKEKAYVYKIKYVHDSLKLVKELTKYLPGVYFIDGVAECSALIYGNIIKEKKNGNIHPNILFTKEVNMLQLPAIDNSIFIYHKQTSERNAMCWGINKMNVMDSYLKITKRWNPVYRNPDAFVFIQCVCDDLTKVKFIDKSNRLVNIARSLKEFDPYNIDIFIGLVGLYGRLDNLITWTSAVKCINKLPQDILISKDYENIYDKLDQGCKIYKKISLEEFVNRMRCVSITHQTNIYINTPEYNIDYRIDLIDSSEIKYINDHYYQHNYIDLNKF